MRNQTKNKKTKKQKTKNKTKNKQKNKQKAHVVDKIRQMVRKNEYRFIVNLNDLRDFDPTSTKE